MSTKIYYAFRWKADMPALLKFLNELRAAYITEATELVKLLYPGIQENIEEKSPFPEYDLERYLFKQINLSHNDLGNIDASVCVYFFEDKIITHLFGIDRPFKSLYKMFVDNPNFQYYGYWNNSDREEEVSEEEWDERARIYDSIFEENGIPNQVGLVYELSSRANISKIARQVVK